MSVQLIGQTKQMIVNIWISVIEKKLLRNMDENNYQQ